MIASQLEILKQGQHYLAEVSQAQYNEVIKPNFMSSAGAHMRHIIDHYLALINGLEKHYIDYDYRLRGSNIETEPQTAMAALNRIKNWLEQLDNTQLTMPLQLSTEICISRQQIALVNTSLGRELVFVGSHAVHHYAMIAQIAIAQGKALPTNFGIAPATASYLRQQ